MIKIDLETIDLFPMSRNEATDFVKTADKFKSKISILGSNLEINAKSVLGLMALGNARHDKLILCIEGEDESFANEKISEYIKNVKNIDKL